MQNYCSRNMHTGRTRSVQPRQSQRLGGGSQVGGAPLARLLEQLTDIECPGRAPARVAPPPPPFPPVLTGHASSLLPY